MTDPAPLRFARLALMDDPAPRSAALNMALDEVLLERLAGEPLLRVYRWERPAVSFGYFEPAAPVEREWPAHDLVRRWTGGGIVIHGEDLTFSLFVPRGAALAALPAVESYRAIHAAVADALAEIGHFRAALHESVLATDVSVSRACFENPVRHDLLSGDRKIAGGAQRRTRHGLLHQGSIQGGDALALDGHNLSALALALPRAFGTEAWARCPEADEIEAAGALASRKYASEQWLRRR